MVRARSFSVADYPLNELFRKKLRKAQWPLVLVTCALIGVSSYSFSANVMPLRSGRRKGGAVNFQTTAVRMSDHQHHLVEEVLPQQELPVLSRRVAVAIDAQPVLPILVANNGTNFVDQIKSRTLWENPPSLGLAPCRSNQRKTAPVYTPQGYLLVTCNGGLNQQRSAICNAAAVARHLNMTLLIPHLKQHLVWKDSSLFQDLFDIDHFIKNLNGEVAVATHVESEDLLKQIALYQNVPEAAPLEWYDTHIRRQLAHPSERARNASASEILLKRQIVRIDPFAHRLAHTLPTFYQQLRCKVNYEALRFTPKIEALASALVRRMRQRSSNKYLAVHLRFEKDMVAYSACDYGGGEEERKDLEEYRHQHWTPSVLRARRRLDPLRQRQSGQCPLSPEELGLFLRALGFDASTHIYAAFLVSELYGGEAAMAPLRAMFPNLIDKSQLATREELQQISESTSSLAAVDYHLCVEADIFVPTTNGNFPTFVRGHRVHLGFRKTIQPDKKRLAQLLMRREEMPWEVLAEKIREEHELSNGGPAKRGRNHNFFANPRECLCQQ